MKRCLKRWSFKLFRDSDVILWLPHISAGREPGGWGYPGAYWAGVGWFRWYFQIAYHDRPRHRTRTGQDLTA